KLDEIEGWHGAAGAAEQNQIAARTEDVQIVVEGVLPYTIINDVDASAFGKAPGFGFKVCCGVHDALIRAGIARELGLFLRAGCSDHARAEFLTHLDQQPAHATGSRMNQRRLAVLDRIRAVTEIMRSHPLEHRGSGVSKVKIVWNLNETIGRNGGVLGVTSQ